MSLNAGVALMCAGQSLMDFRSNEADRTVPRIQAGAMR
jgi:hypothetical protein